MQRGMIPCQPSGAHRPLWNTVEKSHSTACAQTSAIFLRLPRASESPGELTSTQAKGPHRWDSDFIPGRGGLSICISNTFPDDAEASGPGTTLREPRLNRIIGMELILTGGEVDFERVGA